MRHIKIIFSFAICCVFLILIQFPAAAQITISKEGLIRNPTLFFQGIPGNDELSQQVLSDFANCGWFQLTKDKNADYIVSGSGNTRSLTLNIANSAGLTMAQVRGSGESTRECAHKAVDAVLKELFQVDGICNSKIVFVVNTRNGNRELLMCDFDGQNIQQITRNGTHSIEPVWGYDGKTIIYTFYGPTYTSLVQYDLESGKSRKLTSYRGLNAGGALSPTDGRYTALILARDDQVDLYVRETESSKLQRITKNRSVEASPCWSPDGKQICFVSDATGRPTLYVVNPWDGSKPRQLSNISGSERVAPDWSSDNKIAYSARIDKKYYLAVVDMKSGSPVQLNIGPANQKSILIQGEGPSWAPDNRHVVIENNGEILVVDTFLGKTRKLVSGSSRTAQPDWSPLLP